MSTSTASPQIVTTAPATTVGLDLGDRWGAYCALDQAGVVVERGRVRMQPAELATAFPAGTPARIVIEVGTHSPWVSRLLQAEGHEVVVANARRVRLVAESNRKDDRTDAEHLARLGRLDPGLLAPIRHRGEQAQRDIAVLRARDCLVRSRTALVNHVRGAVKAFGGRLPTCSTESFPRKVEAHIPEPLRPALEPLLTTISDLTQRIRAIERAVVTTCERDYPETRLLRQVPGVGPITALAFVLVVEDPARFAKSREIGPYLGLVPRRRQSGRSAPELRITKAGDRQLRRLLVGCAHYILGPFGPDCDLRRWGLSRAPAGQRTARKRTIVAVARRLAVMLHHLWVNGEVYDPLHRSTAAPAA